MNVLFVHNSFPAQFGNLASAYASDPNNQVVAIGSETARTIPGVSLRTYGSPKSASPMTHAFARRFDNDCRRAEQVLFVALHLVSSGFKPDLVVAHCGWGESLPLPAVFPKAKIVVYCELFYGALGRDVHFDPEGARLGADGIVGLQCKNAGSLIALVESDIGLSPTMWQRSTFPSELQNKIKVGHEGIDIEKFKPDNAARLTLPSGRTVQKGDEIVTFVARNLEPLRGFHTFMRSLRAILRARPHAQIIVVGGDGVSYGPSAPPGMTWKQIFIDENKSDLDMSRIHFVGQIPLDMHLRVLQVSAVHIYLSYPFVLSWSLLESMSTGCTVIASDTDPVKEVVDSGNGMLIPFFDSSALAERVIDVLAKPEAFSSLGVRARKTIASQFDKRHCVPKVMRLIGLS